MNPKLTSQIQIPKLNLSNQYKKYTSLSKDNLIKNCYYKFQRGFKGIFIPTTSWTRSKRDSNEVKMACTFYSIWPYINCLWGGSDDAAEEEVVVEEEPAETLDAPATTAAAAEPEAPAAKHMFSIRYWRSW